MSARGTAGEPPPPPDRAPRTLAESPEGAAKLTAEGCAAQPAEPPASGEGEAGRPAKAASAFRTISEVARELDVAQHVLRFWETRFPAIRPLKRSGGRRYYRPEDVELLRRIRTLLYEEGYTIKGAQKVLRGERAATRGSRRATAEPTAATGGLGLQLGGAVRQRLAAIRAELVELRARLQRAFD